MRQHSADHLSYGTHLFSVPTKIVVAGISPPIPASFRIAADLARVCQPLPLRGLRIKNDDVIGIRPSIVSSVAEEEGVGFVDVLLAAMEGHVQTALCSGLRGVLAGSRHIQIGGLVEACALLRLIKEFRL